MSNAVNYTDRHRALTRRATEIYRAAAPRCTCGRDDRSRYWHEPRCAIETAWEDAMDAAKDEWAEREDQEETEAA
jgi:DNA-binding IscR family transcriptional regulator